MNGRIIKSGGPELAEELEKKGYESFNQMKEQLKIDFNKIKEVSNFSNRDIEIKKSYLNKFIENGFPNRKQENWKFLDINQIISNNISDLSFYNDYSIENKIDSSIFIDDLEHNKIIFINGRVEKIDFSYEDKKQIEIIEDSYTTDKSENNNSCLLYTSPSPRDRQKSRMPSSA